MKKFKTILKILTVASLAVISSIAPFSLLSVSAYASTDNDNDMVNISPYIIVNKSLEKDVDFSKIKVSNWGDDKDERKEMFEGKSLLQAISLRNDKRLKEQKPTLYIYHSDVYPNDVKDDDVLGKKLLSQYAYGNKDNAIILISYSESRRFFVVMGDNVKYDYAKNNMFSDFQSNTFIDNTLLASLQKHDYAKAFELASDALFSDFNSKLTIFERQKEIAIQEANKIMRQKQEERAMLIKQKEDARKRKIQDKINAEKAKRDFQNFMNISQYLVNIIFWILIVTAAILLILNVINERRKFKVILSSANNYKYGSDFIAKNISDKQWATTMNYYRILCEPSNNIFKGAKELFSNTSTMDDLKPDNIKLFGLRAYNDSLLEEDLKNVTDTDEYKNYSISKFMNPETNLLNKHFNLEKEVKFINNEVIKE